MQAAKPVAEADRDALLKDIAAELGQHEVVGPGLLHRIISEVQRRYDVVDQRRTTAQKREDPMDVRGSAMGVRGDKRRTVQRASRARGGHDWSPR